MPEPADQPAAPKPPRTWRPMVLWTCAILLAMGLAWFVGAVAVPMWITRKAVVESSGMVFHLMDVLPDYNVSPRLGGQKLAARRLSLYLRLPRKLAPHKVIAVGLLERCGPYGIPELIRALHSDNPAVQRSAASVLAKYGPQARVAIPELMRLLRLGTPGPAPGAVSEEDASDISNVFGSRRFYTVPPTETVPDPSRPRDEVAFLALAAMGPDAAPAMAALVDSPKFRAAAAFWLNKQGDAAIPLLEGWLRSPDEGARSMAMDALGRLGAGADGVFVAAIKDPSARVRCKALTRFRREAPPPAQVAEAAARLIESDPDEQVRSIAVELLPEVPAPFARALSDRSPQVRAFAAARLSRLGSLSAEFVPVLKTALRDEAPAVRVYAARALGRLGPRAADAVEELTALLKVREVTAVKGALHEYCPSDIRGDPFLERVAREYAMFEDPVGCYGYRDGMLLRGRAAAAAALGEIGPAAARAVPAIELLLDDENSKVRAAAAEALKKLRDRAPAQ